MKRVMISTTILILMIGPVCAQSSNDMAASLCAACTHSVKDANTPIRRHFRR
jgi:hypothetical protein